MKMNLTKDMSSYARLEMCGFQLLVFMVNVILPSTTCRWINIPINQSINQSELRDNFQEMSV